MLGGGAGGFALSAGAEWPVPLGKVDAAHRASNAHSALVSGKMCIRDSGHSAGEEFDVNVTFPEEYQAAELAGKAAVFKIKRHEVKYKGLPALDDELAKDLSLIHI